MNVSCLSMSGVRKRFGFRAVLRGVNLVLSPGEVVALVGPNGCGKSTLLAIAAGALDPDDGRVERNGRVGYAPERADVPEQLTTGEWLDLFAALARVPRMDRDVDDPFGVGPTWSHRLGSLSLGQQRRVGLSAAWLAAESVLVLDEPTNGLDADGLATLVSAIDDARARKIAILVATHDRAFADRIQARWARLEGGCIDS